MKFLFVFLLIIAVAFYKAEADPLTCSICKSSFTTFVAKLQSDPTILTNLADQLKGLCSDYTTADEIAGCNKFISFEGFAQVVRDVSVDPDFGIAAMCSGYCQ